MVDKIVDKEVKMVAIRKQFLRDNRERHDEDNYEIKRREEGDKIPSIEEINDQPKEKRLKTKWPYFWLWSPFRVFNLHFFFFFALIFS